MNYLIPNILHKLFKPYVITSSKLKYRATEVSNPLNEETDTFLLLGHHVSDDDPLITLSLSKKYIHFIYGDAIQESLFRKTMLTLGKAIPLTKNTSDIRAILKIKNLVKDKRNIGLYPEGGRNWIGETDIIIPSTVKLIKSLKIPVYLTFYKGGYLSRPRWANHNRKGIIEVSTQLFLTKEQVKNMPLAQLEIQLKKALNYNEFNWQKEKMIEFKGKYLAEDIERILYVCPNCHSIDSFNSKGNAFWCKSCGQQYILNTYGFIENCNEFTDTVSWYHWQTTFLEHITTSDFRSYNKDIQLTKYTKDGTKTNLDNVDFQLHLNELSFYYSNINEVLPIKDIKGISLTLSNLIDFHYNKIKYRIRLNAKQHISIKLLYDYILYIQRGIENDK